MSTVPYSPRGNPAAVFFLVLLAFCGGALLDRAGWLPGSNPAPRGLGRTYNQAWNIIHQNYVDRAKLNDQQMTEGSIAGLAASLGDTGHTTYLTREQFEKLESQLKGHFTGIGIRITVRGGLPTVLSTIPGSPASKKLLRGDMILAVDGKKTADMSLEQFTKMVGGQPGTTVHLQVRREGRTEPLEVDVERADIKLPEVGFHALPGAPIYHVAIHEFGKNTDDQLRAALEEIRQKGGRGLIVDLRGNTGGLRDQAVKVTSEFLKDGIVFIEVNAAGQEKKVPVIAGGVATDIPMVVLIDGSTASSSEIFAGALKDHHRAQLVGTRTFGTGTVLEPFKLKDGSVLLLAVRKWLTPDGHEIWHKGIQPDVEVRLPTNAEVLLPENEEKLTEAQLEKSTDKQVLKAYEMLRKQLKEGGAEK